MARTRRENAYYNRERNERAAICIAAEKARKPSRSRLSGLSDLHARQVHTAESVYYVFNSRVLHTRHSDSTDFHNTAPARAPLDPNGFFSTRKQASPIVYVYHMKCTRFLAVTRWFDTNATV